MKKRLITSALPYVNNIPHLGNLIQVLSADVFARFCRERGYETLYICGTDEYGTATETRAREEGITPKELCSRYYTIHKDIYDWFNISFDKFGRTSTPEQTEITQGIFLKLHKNGYISEQSVQQLYSEESQMFLADRYVRGTCPHCSYAEARGDQCENCGKLLDPSDLIEPRSMFDNSRPVLRETKHLYIDLPAIRPILEKWIAEASVKGFWAHNAIQMTQAWIRDGLKERAITRDLKWGIPVPLDGFREKVFYVWFDAPIGYISITATHTPDWEDWWKNPDEVELFQFIGKDNIPFHTVIFPSSLLGSGENWTMLHHMSSTEYMNYETGKFSKSAGVGVFGNDAKDTGIPADVWRFYIFYNRPETSDYVFTWREFQEKTNGELIGNLGNLVNRTLTFVHRYYDGKVAAEGVESSFRTDVAEREAVITAHLERAELREAFRKIFALASYGNKAFQDFEPWKKRVDHPDGTHRFLSDLVYLIHDLAILVRPYLPATAEKIGAFLGGFAFSWDRLATWSGLTTVGKPEILFAQLEDDHIAELKQRFSGTQAERNAADRDAAAAAPERMFTERVSLRAARITAVERHPKADRLFIETIDDGSGVDRQIVSGLVQHYEESELLGRTIILVANLKPAKLRGVESNGMLLAAETEDSAGESVVEVLFVDHAEPGTPAVLAENAESAGEPGQIDIDAFFEVPIRVVDGKVVVGSTPLSCAGREIRTEKVRDGKVG
ncbi:MAG: methionine--tRNA ligase [Spirochaetaceae bacterium]|nr:MAG: methionine--tRNA ligase [Spirochaetaceae bacterium]